MFYVHNDCIALGMALRDVSTESTNERVNHDCIALFAFDGQQNREEMIVVCIMSYVKNTQYPRCSFDLPLRRIAESRVTKSQLLMENGVHQHHDIDVFFWCHFFFFLYCSTSTKREIDGFNLHPKRSAMTETTIQ